MVDFRKDFYQNGYQHQPRFTVKPATEPKLAPGLDDQKLQYILEKSFLNSDNNNNQKSKAKISNILDRLYESFPKRMTRLFWDILDPENPHCDMISDDWREKIISLVSRKPLFGIANFFINQITDYKTNLYSKNKKTYIASLNFHLLFQTGIESDNGKSISFNLDKSPLLKQILKGNSLDVNILQKKLKKICSETGIDFKRFQEHWVKGGSS
jgi:hypothetical protein